MPVVVWAQVLVLARETVQEGSVLAKSAQGTLVRKLGKISQSMPVKRLNLERIDERIDERIYGRIAQQKKWWGSAVTK